MRPETLLGVLKIGSSLEPFGDVRKMAAEIFSGILVEIVEITDQRVDVVA